MKLYAIASIAAIAVPLCLVGMTNHGDIIEPISDGGAYSVIAEPNEDDGLNLEEYVTFKGTVKELNDKSAVVVPNKDEDIFQSGDLVAIELPKGCQLKVGEEVTVEYDGNIMDSYPLQVNVISVNGIQMNDAVQANVDFNANEGMSTDGEVFEYVDVDGNTADVPSIEGTIEPVE